MCSYYSLHRADMPLFNDATHKATIKAGYGTAKRARNTIRRLRHTTQKKARQVAQTMYFRAKYHKHQTKGMKNAMKIYQRYLGTLKN